MRPCNGVSIIHVTKVASIAIVYSTLAGLHSIEGRLESIMPA